MAGRVKTQLFRPEPHPVLGGHKNEKTPDKNEIIFQRTFQQVVFAILINLASSGNFFVVLLPCRPF